MHEALKNLRFVTLMHAVPAYGMNRLTLDQIQRVVRDVHEHAENARQIPGDSLVLMSGNPTAVYFDRRLQLEAEVQLGFRMQNDLPRMHVADTAASAVNMLSELISDYPHPVSSLLLASSDDYLFDLAASLLGRQIAYDGKPQGPGDKMVLDLKENTCQIITRIL